MENKCNTVKNSTIQQNKNANNLNANNLNLQIQNKIDCLKDDEVQNCNIKMRTNIIQSSVIIKYAKRKKVVNKLNVFHFFYNLLSSDILPMYYMFSEMTGKMD